MERGQGRRKGRPLATFALWRLLAVVLALLLCACSQEVMGPHGRKPMLLSGTERPDRAPGSLLRADPGYIQWLERQSMLGNADDLAAEVSGSERLWGNSGSNDRLPLLLDAAPCWLEVNPHTLRGKATAMQSLARSGTLEAFRRMGFSGLYLSPSQEQGALWHNQLRPDFGTGTTSLAFDARSGDDEQFARLNARAATSGFQLGGSLPPAATGLGPDFFLQARHASRFSGLYAMMEAPSSLWSTLPASPQEWECLPLNARQCRALTDKGLLPPALLRDSLPWATPGGWAVTGEVRGADGKPRRWLYRYAGNVLRPVLLWQDPSGQARRVLSAAVIRHTGLQQQTLAGLHLEAIMGLDVPPDGGAPSPRDQLAPGLEALDALAREIHRYGGWAMQADILPPSLMPLIQRAPVDLTRDTVTSPAAEYALLTGDVAPLAALLRQSMNSGVRQEGLARGLHQWRGVDWRPLRDLPGGEALFQRACRLAGLHDDEYFWPTTPAGLAREALGRKPDAVPARDRRDTELEEASLLLLAWRVGLPGLVFVSPQELQGALPLPKSTPGTAASAGLVPLLEPETAAGEVEPAPLAFGPLSEELRLPRSPASIMARLLHARAVSGVARGRLLRVVSGPAGTLATVTRLPDGSCWVLAANFGSASATLRIPLPVSGAAQDIVEQTSLAVRGGLTVTLNGRSARHYLVGAAASPKEPS